MKSIKEKAKEYASGYMNLDRQLVARDACEYGANYVLDHLSKTIAVSDDSYLLSNLKKLILQLKK